MKFSKIFFGLVFFCLLTVLTQIGGIVFLLSILLHGLVDKRFRLWWTRLIAKSFCFLTLYLLFVFALVPLAARPFGRVPLPVFAKHGLQPANFLTCLLNRHYVRPTLREIAFSVAEGMNTKYPGTIVNYLDGNFPFVNKFPLLPHLSHSDGKKLDLAFLYRDSSTGLFASKVPSFTGYGICEEPTDGEINMPEQCAAKGYWQYNKLRELVPQKNKGNFTFDSQRTKDLVSAFASADGIGRIFIEPHLKTRLRLTSSKIVFHGCQAVRHDDHVHVQLK